MNSSSLNKANTLLMKFVVHLDKCVLSVSQITHNVKTRALDEENSLKR